MRLSNVVNIADLRRLAARRLPRVVFDYIDGGAKDEVTLRSLRVLPEVVAAVGDRVEVLMDGGIRRGADIVKARCLGARAALIGRAYAWALGAAGGPGVSRAIDILKTDLVRTMRLLGCASMDALDRSFVETPPAGSRRVSPPEDGR